MKTKYILTTDYEVVEVKNKMFKPKTDIVYENGNAKTVKYTGPGTHYLYAYPEDHCGFLAIHKDNVLLEAKDITDMTNKINADKELTKKFIEATKDQIKKEYELQTAFLNMFVEIMEEDK